MVPAAPARDTTGPYWSRDCAPATAPLLVGPSRPRPASHSYFPNVDSVRSRRARFEHRNRNRLAGADVIAIDQRAAIVAHGFEHDPRRHEPGQKKAPGLFSP